MVKTLVALVIALSILNGCKEQPDAAPADKMEQFRQHVRKQKIQSESRWSLTYYDCEMGADMVISKFMLGDASITTDQLRKEWPDWTEDARLEFCNNVGFADTNDLPDLVRIVMEDGDTTLWSAISPVVARCLPEAEAVPFLLAKLQAAPLGKGSNFAQSLARTKAPAAEKAIRARFDRLWNAEDIFAFTVPGPDMNWVAFEATCCIGYLVELGVPRETLKDRAEAMLKHPNPPNRETAKRHLEEHFGGTR